ncbi:MAG: hypothetical protein HYR86_12450 [Candidatus Rokubacteria bacterium]|nr:hypothetical protein [Candidatus Rokubacteria bacterium]
MTVATFPGRRPATALPLRFFVAAAVAYIGAAFGVAGLAPELSGHYYHPRLLALTHTLTLGWITMTILGASYQLVPVALERPMWSERLARWQFVIFLVGVVGMVAHFFIGERSGLAWAAGLVGIACGAHVLNVALSVRGLSRWSFTARLVILALAGLAATALLGLALALGKLWPFMPSTLFASLHAHLHLALLGWVAPMIIGVGARVYPMFLLAREPQGWPAAVQLWGIVVGAPAIVVGLLVDSGIVLVAGALCATAAGAGHLVWLLDIMRTRKRRQLDWGLRFVLTAAAFLPLAMLMGLGFALDVLRGPRLGLAYAVVVMGGWVSLTIVGMTLKIVPFLVWYRVYALLAGRQPVPSLAELSFPLAERAAYGLLTGGTVALVVAALVGDAAWIRAAGLVLGAGALAFAVALGSPLALLARRTAAPRAGDHVGVPGKQRSA